MQGTQDFIDRQFELPGQFLSDLDAESAAELITAAADVVLVLDVQGVIRDIAFDGDEVISKGCQDWVGKNWAQTVTVESQVKVRALLKDSLTGDGVRWRQVNLPVAGAQDLPLSYSVVPVRRSSCCMVCSVHRVTGSPLAWRSPNAVIACSLPIYVTMALRHGAMIAPMRRWLPTSSRCWTDFRSAQ